MGTKALLPMCGAMLLVSVPVASAFDVLNIAWDTCVLDGGAVLRATACTSNSNAGTSANVAVMSIVLDTPIPAYYGLVGFVDVVTAGSELPSWWGRGCPGKLTPFSAVGGSSRCSNDAYALSGGGTGGLAQTNFMYNGANTIQAVYSMANAAGSEIDLQAGTEYFLGSITLSNEKTAGSGACPGCNVPACLRFAQANIDYAVDGVWHQKIISGGNGGQPWVYWQSGSGAYMCAWYYDPTRSKNNTWGAIKSLYR